MKKRKGIFFLTAVMIFQSIFTMGCSKNDDDFFLCTKVTTYNSDDTINSTTEYEYIFDDHSRKEIVFSTNTINDHKWYFTECYHYGEKDHVSEIIRYYGHNEYHNMESVQKFDSKDNITYYALYNPDGTNSLSFEETYSYTYDADGNMLSKTEENENSRAAYQYYYNEKGEKTAEEFQYYYYPQNGAGESYTEFFYDDGKLIASNSDSQNMFGEITRTIKKYNEKEQCISEEVYDEDNMIYSTIEYKYDEKYNLISEMCYNSEHSMIYGYEDEYDKYGMLIKHINYNSNGIGNYLIYEYDTKQSLIANFA